MEFKINRRQVLRRGSQRDTELTETETFTQSSSSEQMPNNQGGFFIQKIELEKVNDLFETSFNYTVEGNSLIIREWLSNEMNKKLIELVTEQTGRKLKPEDLIYIKIPSVFNGLQVYLPDNCEGLFAQEDEKTIMSIDYVFDFSELKDTSNVTNMSKMFYHLKINGVIFGSNFNTSNVKDMSRMFAYSRLCLCNNFKTIDVSMFNTSKVTDMTGMFERIIDMEKLDLSSFDTSNVEKMDSMFDYSDHLKELNIGGFNTSKVKSMNRMFANTKIFNINLDNFDTSNVVSMEEMFASSSVIGVNLSSFNTEKVKTFYKMFYNCEYLKRVILDSFYTPSLENIEQMFALCKKLDRVVMPKFDYSRLNRNGCYGLFCYCKSLNEVVMNGFIESLKIEPDNVHDWKDTLRIFRCIYEDCNADIIPDDVILYLIRKHVCISTDMVTPDGSISGFKDTFYSSRWEDVRGIEEAVRDGRIKIYLDTNTNSVAIKRVSKGLPGIEAMKFFN